MRGEDGEMYVHDPTYLNSYNIWQDMALGFHRELSLGELNGERATERLSSAMMSAVGSMIQPFTDEAMFTSLMTDLNYAWQNEQGRTSAGRKVFEDKDSLGESVFDAMGYVALNFAPGFVLDSKKFAEAVFETPNETTAYSSNNVRYETFKIFAIKIALVADTTYDMPRVKDMRAHAVD